MGTMPSGKPPASPFTVHDFQLVLLRRMADHNPDLVEGARHTLGASIADMREANKRWQAMVRSPRARAAASRYRSVLGAPGTVLTRTVGDLECEAWLSGPSRSGPTCASRSSWPRPARSGTSG